MCWKLTKRRKRTKRAKRTGGWRHDGLGSENNNVFLPSSFSDKNEFLIFTSFNDGFGTSASLFFKPSFSLLDSQQFHLSKMESGESCDFSRFVTWRLSLVSALLRLSRDFFFLVAMFFGLFKSSYFLEEPLKSNLWKRVA